MYKVIDSAITKAVIGPEYNTLYHRWKSCGDQLLPSGELLRWGKTIEDDPDYSPIGPEIADIEISSGGCPGILSTSGRQVGCSFCYKNNNPTASVKNMNFNTYKEVLDKLTSTKNLTQVALGLTGVKANPDLIKIMRYTRNKNCFPNFTLTGADLDYNLALDLSDLCGALAVSCSPTNIDLCFDTVSLFTSLGVEQTNIHVVVSKETMPFVYKVLDDRMNDPRLQDMGAIVCLIIKPKGRAKHTYHPPTQEQYDELVYKALKHDIPIGFDSCSAHRFLKSIETADISKDQKDLFYMDSDPCESLCFSIYVSVDGLVYPCSFCEGEEGYKPINLLGDKDFLKDVWLSPTAKQFRENLISRGRKCPAFPQIDEPIIVNSTCMTKQCLALHEGINEY
jgi:hypothetical protein